MELVNAGSRWGLDCGPAEQTTSEKTTRLLFSEALGVSQSSKTRHSELENLISMTFTCFGFLF